ncbi:MAG: EVE domain-containing protein [Chloroflexi bacterium]|nr:EVE domain-containing protein [Chloroflexota bacterium]
MGNHIFLTSQENFAKCMRFGIYGGIAHAHEPTNAEIIAGFSGIKAGDLAFFYVSNVGIYGLWRITTGAFYDETDLYGNPQQKYPYRVCIEPVIRQFSKPIRMSDILDLRDKGRIWTFDLDTIGKKSQHPLTTDEGKELIRLLLRNNPIFSPVTQIPEPYGGTGKSGLPFKLDTNRRGQITYEGNLNAWFMNMFRLGQLRDIIGDYKDFLNFVPTSFNTVMDVFLTHVTSVDSVDILHKYTCLELKTGVCTEANLNQILKYDNWLVRKLANGDSEMVQSVIVAFEFHEKVLEYVRRRKQIEEKTVRLLKYRVDHPKQDIVLDEL